MSQKRGSTHEFLGMVLEYKKQKFTVSMEKHVQKAIDTFAGKVTQNAATPAKGDLFEINENTLKLDEDCADNFHSVVASLLFISKQCQLDIQTTVAFLTTQVSNPDKDDWSKLRRVLQYLRGTMNMKLVIGGDDIHRMKAWVDVSYGVHSDCRSHTGGCISFGWGVILTMCQKQKLNVKSSTEGEFIGASDYLPNMIWARMFLEEQGFKLDENILYQDNVSAIKLETNGRVSSGKRTKHINNRFFWIKDRVNSEGITIKYCPTKIMVADFFTKPLQGETFKRLRRAVMGHIPINSLEESNDQDIVSTGACWN